LEKYTAAFLEMLIIPRQYCAYPMLPDEKYGEFNNCPVHRIGSPTISGVKNVAINWLISGRVAGNWSFVGNNWS